MTTSRNSYGTKKAGRIPSPAALRQGVDAAALRRLARSSKDGRQTRRLLAMAELYDSTPASDGGEPEE